MAFNSKSPMIPTIIIVQELSTEIRGYTLVGREFILKEPYPCKAEGVLLDGTKIVDEYWVISKEEYIRVVPEARYTDIDSDVVLIPTFVAKLSFKPCYLK